MPPFRAEHIGSLLRPASLLELRRRHALKQVTDLALRTAEDAAIRDAVAYQEGLGLRVVTDGEFRRRSYPRAMRTSPAATAAPEPDEDPPGA